MSIAHITSLGARANAGACAPEVATMRCTQIKELGVLLFEAL